MTEPLLILGATEFSAEIADVARAAGFDVVGFVENLEPRRSPPELDGLPVHWIDDIVSMARDHVVVCGLGTTTRARFAADAERHGFVFATVIHPSAVVSPRSSIGPGSVVGAGVVVAAHSELAPQVLVNRGATIGHHTQVGSFTTLGPGTHVAGRCNVGASTYVGIGAVVLDGLSVGAGSIIAGGSVVISDVESRVLVAGAPAQVKRRAIQAK